MEISIDYQDGLKTFVARKLKVDEHEVDIDDKNGNKFIEDGEVKVFGHGGWMNPGNVAKEIKAYRQYLNIALNEINIYEQACRKYRASANRIFRAALLDGSTEVDLTDYNNNEDKLLVFGDEGAKAIAAALKVNKNITNIYFAGNNIGDEGARALAEALKDNKNITYFELWLNKVGNEGAMAFAEALKDNKSLTEIDLSSNSIGDDGAKALAEALKANKSLTDIELSDNRIGEIGARALAEALKINNNLTILGLHRNMIGNEGAMAFAEALKINKSLTKIYVSDYTYCNIGDQGVGAMYDTIGDEAARAFAEALKDNNSLTELGLQSHKISVEGYNALYKARDLRDAKGKPIKLCY